MNKNIFTKHPETVGESYLQHFGKAFGFSCLLFTLSQAFVHAVLPFCYVTAVSDRIKVLNEGMQKRIEKATKEH